MPMQTIFVGDGDAPQNQGAICYVLRSEYRGAYVEQVAVIEVVKAD